MTKEEFEQRYFYELLNDLPICVNNVNFYPVKMEDKILFSAYSSILQIKKDRIPDVEIISMSYLDYIKKLIEQESSDGNDKDKVITSSLIRLLIICTNGEADDISIGNSDRGSYLRINESYFYNKEFNLLKDIILFQNIPDYTGIELNPQLEEDLMESARLRNIGKKQCSLEKIELSLMIDTGLKFDDIKKMSIRKFHYLLEMVNRKLEYRILRQASLSGMVKFEKEILHYLEEDCADGFSDNVMSYDNFKDKFGTTSKFN